MAARFGGGSPLLALIPELVRKVAGRPLPRAEGRPQLADFIAMTRAVVIEHDDEARCIQGELPRELCARYFAGGWYTRSVPPVDHLLDAYSTMVGWYLGEGRARVRVRPISDPSRDREIETGRILRKGLATQRSGSLLARTSTEIGRVNVHECVAFDGAILAVSTPRCLRIEPESLEHRGPDAFAAWFDARDPAVVHNNHPQIDPRTGHLVTGFVRYTPVYSTILELFEVDAGGARRNVRTHYSPSFNAVHAFAFTESSYVIPDNPLHPPGLRYVLGLGRGALEWMREDVARPLSLHVLPRDPTEPPLTVALPERGFVYHVLNSFDDGDVVQVDAFVSNLDPERESSQFELDPRRSVSTNLGGVFRFSVDRRSGAVGSRLLLPGVQRVTFDCIDERVRGLPYRRAWFVANGQHETGRSEVLAADAATGTTERWSTSERVFFRQPRFVPAPGAVAEGPGWLLVPGYTPTDSRLFVFDAQRVSAGPVAVLSAGTMLPYTNHGCIG